MNVADRDQYVASVRDSAEQLRMFFDALRAVGFRRWEALALLRGTFTQNAGIIQAQALDRMVEQMRDPDED